MNHIPKSTLLLTIFSVLFFLKSAIAQPGWQDYTARYSYTILDAKGKEISFKKNKQYSIMIDSVLFKSPRIPHEKLKPAVPNEGDFANQIKINDFSLAIPQKNYSRGGKRLEIKLIHKRDTMYICQASGRGSFGENGFWNGADIKPKNSSDFTLQFIAGRYYFPDWAKYFLDNLPQVNGNLELKNASQRNFIVSQKVYNSVHSSEIYYHKKLLKKADDYVTNNFLKGHLSLERRVEPVQFKQSPAPYKNAHWEGKIYASKNDTNRYYGMMSYSMNTSNCSSYKNVFSVLNKGENTIDQFFPKDNLRLFGSQRLYVDTFNAILYLPLWTKKEFDFYLTDCQHNKPTQRQTYRS